MRAFFAIDLPPDLADRIAAVQDPIRAAPGVRLTDPQQAHITLEFLGDVPAAADDVPAAADDGPAAADRDSQTDRTAAAADIETVIQAGREAVQDAAVEPFTVSVRGLGAFPSREYIRVIWAGIETGTAEIRRLQAAIESRTVALGYDPADHEFTPHVTIGRMDDARGKEIAQSTIRDGDADIGSFTVDAVQLKRSTLTESGPVYDTVESFALSS